MADTADASIPTDMLDSSDSARSESQGVPAGLLVGAIAVLVVLVSLPRFRAHALEANRTDARVALDVIGTVVFDEEWAAAVDREPDVTTLPDVVETNRALRHRFPDARRAADNGELVHHGYRFDTGYVVEGIERRPALLAWPNDYGKSGDVAYALTSDGAMWGHENDALWTSGERALRNVDLSDEGWVRIRAPR